MKSNIREEDIIFRYPSKEEIKAAQLACCGRCCDACETPAEYAWRKRGVDMAILLEKAIEAELSESERKAVRAHWYESMSVKEIAASQGISSAAVSVTLKRAQDKLHRALRYAVGYRLQSEKESAVSLVLANARVVAAARNSVGSSLGERLRNLRLRDNISLESLARATGVSSRRLTAFETEKSEPCLQELLALSEAYGVTSDYLLKGENYGKQ